MDYISATFVVIEITDVDGGVSKTSTINAVESIDFRGRTVLVSVSDRIYRSPNGKIEVYAE